jgi:hypothetical protein
MDENKSDVVSFLRSVGAPQWLRHLVEHCDAGILSKICDADCWCWCL